MRRGLSGCPPAGERECLGEPSPGDGDRTGSGGWAANGPIGARESGKGCGERKILRTRGEGNGEGAEGSNASVAPATPDEARQILGLKGLDKVNW